ncbi:PKD domain-containing protein [Streptacidiphilus sp. N1-10]|uniref:PKD domain-containing protein n=1 Tax=Streptacidiphilus jeojiensis TaxID=3229225 RepID=A0ABV6XID9_9ACTN
MRIRPLAVSTVLALTGAGLTLANPVAFAAGSTLYVSMANGCSDTGPATAAEPLCSIQVAADRAEPGDTVQIGPDYLSRTPVVLTHSGTPDAPITFTTTSFADIEASSGPSLTISGAHDIVVDGKIGLYNTGTALSITDSNRITIQRGSIGSPSATFTATQPAVALSGSTGQVTLTRETIAQASRDQVSIGAGVSGTVLSDDAISDPFAGSAVTATDAPGTVLVNDTVLDSCADAIHLAGTSTSSTMKNNIVSTATAGSYCAPTTDTAQISVDAAATDGTALDYNLVHSATTGTAYATAPYQWAGTAYSDPASLNTATTQGAHDLEADPLLNGYAPTEGSPAIDSADAAAAPALDLRGLARVDDPLVANTGTGTGYTDRGAYEAQNPLTFTSVDLTPAKGPYPLNVTATAAVKNPWNVAITYTFDFGDGSTPVTSDSPTATHTYTAATPKGGDTIIVTATSPGGASRKYVLAAPTVTAPAPLVPHLTVTHSPATPYTYTADTSGSTDAWQITDTRTDFGDGTPVTDTATPGPLTHAYTTPGRHTVTVTETDYTGATATTTQQITVGSSYVPDGPVRILDTRNGTGATKAIVPAGGTLNLKVTGAHGVPATGVTAVVLNLTATTPTAAGYTTAHPGGTATPTASNLNYTRGQTVANQITVPVAADGTIALTASPGAAVHLIADLQGYYTTNTNTAGSAYTATGQYRVLDTRISNRFHNGPIAAGQTINVPVATTNVPSATSYAVLRVTATAPTTGGYLTAYTGGTARPAVSSLNFAAGQTVSNLVNVPVGADGTVNLYNSTGKTQAVIDLIGTFTTATDSLTGNPFIPTNPTRILDTRNGTGTPKGTLGSGKHLTLKVAGTTNVPAGATAVLVNLTTTGSSAGGYLTAYAAGDPNPGTSTLNFTTGQTTSTLTLIPVSSNGTISIYNYTGTTNVIADLEGYYTP